jgi:hypothetical protein
VAVVATAVEMVVEGREKNRRARAELSERERRTTT